MKWLFAAALACGGCNTGGLPLAPAPDLATPTRLDLSLDLSIPIDLTTSPMDLGTFDLTTTLDLRPLVPPPPFDGTCTSAAMGGGVYDPDCVYLLGTLQEGACYRDVLVSPGQPQDYVAGFGCYIDHPLLRPSDGKLIYTDIVSGQDLALSFDVDAVSPFASYPTLLDDTVLPTAQCPSSVLRIYSFRDGTLAYTCRNSTGQVYVQGSLTPILTQGTPIAFGAGRSMLVYDPPGLAVVEAGQRTTINGLPSVISFRVARSTGTGYLLAAQDSGYYKLYEISLAGALSVRGTYQTSSAILTSCVLEPSGALICFTRGSPPAFPDTVTRFTTNNSPVLIYDEAQNPVKIHISHLLTGP
jgi:hypothetical protein